MLPDEERARDNALAIAFQEGDRQAFAELIERHQDRLYRVAYRVTGDADDALDAVQEAFIKINRAIGDWDGRASFGSWAYRIATNVAIDQVRRYGRDRKARETILKRHGQSLVEAPPEPDPLEQEDEARLLERVKAAIEELPPGQRAIVALRHYEGLSLAEIADIRGCAIGTVKSTLHQAFRKLKTRLSAEVADARERVSGTC